MWSNIPRCYLLSPGVHVDRSNCPKCFVCFVPPAAFHVGRRRSGPKQRAHLDRIGPAGPRAGVLGAGPRPHPLHLQPSGGEQDAGAWQRLSTELLIWLQFSSCAPERYACSLVAERKMQAGGESLVYHRLFGCGAHQPLTPAAWRQKARCRRAANFAWLQAPCKHRVTHEAQLEC